MFIFLLLFVGAVFLYRYYHFDDAMAYSSGDHELSAYQNKGIYNGCIGSKCVTWQIQGKNYSYSTSDGHKGVKGIDESSIGDALFLYSPTLMLCVDGYENKYTLGMSGETMSNTNKFNRLSFIQRILYMFGF
ncbi:hypothetical protein [Thiothrix subterranea]|uniref:Uncharacterized protein n=1 Tax=Thiothrix subterranea TaxID=2735563 RepID=A0AA51MRA3_9GAMM|nr:hypothetical protein [Thiothrix subterranea]MDQ5770173.1 hypothetical protein [Thiothrix subterranea]WML88915.1 hypothetical protein RCG00_11170 [Thiothrix subterranea]